MRQLKAIGYDMDYTLIHYDVEVWERRAYEYTQARLAKMGWPVEHLRFDPEMVIRGLIVDTERGNVVKANRFGFVKKAMHGTRVLDFQEQRTSYARTIVDLSGSRWVFLNTLFSLSEGCMYAQLVDMLDEGKLPGPMGYAELYKQVRLSTDKTHMEGALKAEIMADPARFVVLDAEIPLALLDQKSAGKKLMLVTNSEWSYTRAMMTFAFDPFLGGSTWRELFDVVIVSARKPEFFSGHAPFFEVATEEGLLRPDVGKIVPGKAYLGGSAAELERHLGISGDDVLYVGDHMFGDVHVTNRVLRWRTGLVLRELENEVDALARFARTEQLLADRMRQKETMEDEMSQLKLLLQRKRAGYGPPVERRADEIEQQVAAMRSKLVALDAEIAPMAKGAAELHHPVWGPLTRAGNDKSHLARQIERYADIYTSRVSNFLHATPFVYLRSPRGSLPHDPLQPGGPPLVAP
jgi:HAD superfamily 5'-nucleotidase-like hydrolase